MKNFRIVILYLLAYCLLAATTFADTAAKNNIPLVPETVVKSWGYKTTAMVGQSQTIVATEGKKIKDGENDNAIEMRYAEFSLGKNCFPTAEALEAYYDKREAKKEESFPGQTHELSNEFVVHQCLYYVYTDQQVLFSDRQAKLKKHFQKYVESLAGVKD